MKKLLFMTTLLLSQATIFAGESTENSNPEREIRINNIENVLIGYCATITPLETFLSYKLFRKAEILRLTKRGGAPIRFIGAAFFGISALLNTNSTIQALKEYSLPPEQRTLHQTAIAS